MRVCEIDDRLARAADQGFTVDAYHGTDRSFTQFKHRKGAHLGFHFGSTPLAATERLAAFHKSDYGLKRKATEPIYDPETRDAAMAKLRQEYAAINKALSAIDAELRSRYQPADREEVRKALESGDEAELTRVLAIAASRVTPAETAKIAKLRATLEELERRMSHRFAHVMPGEQIIPVKLRLQNPLRMNDTNWGDPVRISNDNRSLRLPDDSLEDIRDTIEQRGYDGIVYKNEVEAAGADSYIVFHPDQIRSRHAKFDPAKSYSGKLMDDVTPGHGVGRSPRRK